MAAKKKTKSGKTAKDTPVKVSASERKKMKTEEERRKKILRKLAGILLYILFNILLFLSYYSDLLGTPGNLLKNTVLGIFGAPSYIIPFMLIFFFFYYFIRKKKGGNLAKIYLICGFLINLSALFSLVSYRTESVDIKIERFYKDGVRMVGGGMVGGLVSEPLKQFISYVGALVFLIIVMAFLVMGIFYELLIKYVDYKNEEKEEKKKEREKAKEEKKERKSDRIVSVDKDTGEILSDEVLKPFVSKDRMSFDKMQEIYDSCDHGPLETTNEEKMYESESAKDLFDEEKEITKAEQDVKEERNKLDAILSGKTAEEKTASPIEDKVEEITVRPFNKRIEYKYPSIELLDDNKTSKSKDNTSELKAKALKLENILESFGVEAEVVNIERGPSITRFELQPKSGVRLAKINNLADDIKMNLAAASIRIAPIPGKAVVGIEVPNDRATPVYIKEIISSESFQKHKSKIAFTVGMDITGQPVIGDLAKMPHVLIAGATGSGKSVCINSLITSILYKANPNEVKLIMIDPKVVELGVYNGIPHLLIPVVTDPRKAASALNWAVMEMQQRYNLFAEAGVRNIEGYNNLKEKEDPEEKLPQIVIIIDELADLMMVAPKDVEAHICRIAQLARAAGMHLVIATQRPSVNVITGLIKANIPSRIAFAVTSSIDSRTILDIGGAEKLLGKGDMLYHPAGASKAVRVQGGFISDKEIERVVNVVKANSTVQYNDEISEFMEKDQVYEGDEKSKAEEAKDCDERLNEAIELVLESNTASTSFLQRRMGLGYARAARIVDQMEARGIIGPQDGSKPRQILITREQFYEMQLGIQD